MNYIFPATKFITENNIWEQIMHVKSEWEEFTHTNPGTEEFYEEAMDIYHSLETLFRIWKREGVDMDEVRQKVYEKNRGRGYYLK